MKSFKILRNVILCFVIAIISLFVFCQKPISAANTNRSGANPYPDTSGNDLQLYFRSIDSASDDMNLMKWLSKTEGNAPMLGTVPGISGALYQLVAGNIGNIYQDVSFSEKPNSFGAIGAATQVFAIAYTRPPASSKEYFADIAKNAGVFNPSGVYASENDDAFTNLGAILTLWKTFRNVAYALMAIVFSLVGLAIMFRLKINPQTVISIQSAIPRLVIVLILITFSYAIAGLVIDLMYVVIGLADAILKTDKIMADHLNIITFSGTFMKDGMTIAGKVSDILNPVMWGLGGLSEGWVEGIFRLISAPVAIASGSMLLGLILSIMVLFSFVKVLIMLIKSYVGIIIKIVFAPLQILLGAFPGSNAGFGSWLRSLIADVAIFPTVVIILMLASRIVDLISSSSGAFWAPPILYSAQFPAILGGLNEAVASMVAFGFILMTPKAAEMIQAAMAGKPFDYGSAIGETMKGATSAATAPVRGTWKAVGFAANVKKTYDTLFP